MSDKSEGSFDTTGNVVLSTRASQHLSCLLENNAEGLLRQRELLNLLLVEVVQQNVGDDDWPLFAKVLADNIDFINCILNPN